MLKRVRACLSAFGNIDRVPRLPTKYLSMVNDRVVNEGD